MNLKLKNIDLVHAVKGAGFPSPVLRIAADHTVQLDARAPFVVVRPVGHKAWGIPLSGVKRVEFDDETSDALNAELGATPKADEPTEENTAPAPQAHGKKGGRQ